MGFNSLGLWIMAVDTEDRLRLFVLTDITSVTGTFTVSQNLLGPTDKPDVSVNQTNPLKSDLVKPGQRTPLFASIAVSTAGANQIVAADVANKIKVIAGLVIANGTVNVKWQSGPTDLTGLAYLVVNTGYVLPVGTQFHYFETALNQALNLNLSAAIAVSGFIVYIKEAS